jgi:hypothetical protein
MKSFLLPIALFFSTGCDAALDHVDNLACTFIPWYVADCTSPEVHDKAVSILTDGIVEAQITCQGIAFSPGNVKFASVYYQASRLQDSSCYARADVSGPGAPGTGFIQSSGSNLTGRSSTSADSCPVTSFHPPMLRTNTTVVDGIVRVEGPFCTSAAGQFCTMTVVNNCVGDLNQF